MTPSNQDHDFQQFQKIMGDSVAPIDGGKPQEPAPAAPQQSAAAPQAPAVEETVISLDDSPEPEKPQQPADFNSFLSGKFGRDEQTLQSELQELESLRELSKADPYKSPLGKQFDQLLAQNVDPQAAIRYLTSDETKLSDKEVLMFKMQREMPDASAEQISKYIDKKYGLGDFAPKKEDGEGGYVKDEEAEKDNLFQLKMDSQPVRKEFKSLKEELIKPHVSRETVEKGNAEKQRLASWASVKDKIKAEFKQITIPVGRDKDGNPLAKLTANVKDFDIDLDQIIESNPGLKADEEGVNYVKQVLEDAYLLRNKSEIFHKVGQYYRSLSDKEWQERIHHPAIKVANPNDFGGAPKKTYSDQLVEGWQKALS